MVRIFTISFILCLIANLSFGQEEKRYTEEEIAAIDAYMAAKVEMYKERYDLAIPLLLEIYRKDRQNAMAAFDLTKSYEATEDFPNADKYASIAVRLDPTNIWIRLHYGQLMIKMEKFYEAAEAFETLSKQDPEDYSHIENFGKCLIRTGQQKLAIRVLDEWEERYGVHEPISRLKFEVYKDQKNNGAAEKELLKLVNQSPHNIRYLNNLASFYTNNNDVSKAINIYNRILEIDPNDNKANTAMISLAPSDKKDGPFLRSLLPLIEKQDIDPDLKIKELLPYLNQLNTKFDQEVANSLIELTRSLTLTHPENAKSHAIHGDVLMLMNITNEASKAYIKTLELNDGNYIVWQQLFHALLNQNSYSKLSEFAFNAIDLFPNEADAYFFYGIAENENGNTAEAIDYLQEGLMIAGKNVTVKSNILAELSRSQFINGNINTSEQTVNEALRLSDNNNPYALEVKGDILLARGNKTEAIKMWQAAKKLGSNRNSLLKKLNQ